jgi:hypothetical protein
MIEKIPITTPNSDSKVRSLLAMSEPIAKKMLSLKILR